MVNFRSRIDKFRLSVLNTPYMRIKRQKTTKTKNFCFHRNLHKKIPVCSKIYRNWCYNSREIVNVLFLEHSILQLIYTVNILKYTHYWIENELRITNLPQLKQFDHSFMNYDSFCQFQSSISKFMKILRFKFVRFHELSFFLHFYFNFTE